MTRPNAAQEFKKLALILHSNEARHNLGRLLLGSEQGEISLLTTLWVSSYIRLAGCPGNENGNEPAVRNEARRCGLSLEFDHRDVQGLLC